MLIVLIHLTSAFDGRDVQTELLFRNVPRATAMLLLVLLVAEVARVVEHLVRDAVHI